MTDSYKRDKFRARIERGSEPGTVEIYISHRGSEQMPMKIGQGGSPEDWNWMPSPPNPQLEAEFLEKLMVALGTPAPAAAQAIAAETNSPDRARIDKSTEGAQLVVDDTFDRAWRRVGLALDRTGFTVVDRDRSKGLYFVRYANPDLAKKKPTKGWLADTLEQDAVLENGAGRQARAISRRRDPGRSSQRRYGAGSEWSRRPHAEQRENSCAAQGPVEVTA